MRHVRWPFIVLAALNLAKDLVLTQLNISFPQWIKDHTPLVLIVLVTSAIAVEIYDLKNTDRIIDLPIQSFQHRQKLPRYFKEALWVSELGINIVLGFFVAFMLIILWVSINSFFNVQTIEIRLLIGPFITIWAIWLLLPLRIK